MKGVIRRMTLEYIDISDDKYKIKKENKKMTQHELARKELKDNKKVTEMTTTGILVYLIVKHKFFLMSLYAACITATFIAHNF